ERGQSAVSGCRRRAPSGSIAPQGFRGARPISRAAVAASSAGVGTDWSEGPAIVTPSELTPGVLRLAILRNGCLLVRGLVAPTQTARLRDAIDRAFEAREATLARRATAETAVWYDPVERVPKDASRTWVRLGQGVLAADSPRAFFEFLETVREIGLDRIIAGYFGERPALSIEKTTLRRSDVPSPVNVAPGRRLSGDGHPDGRCLDRLIAVRARGARPRRHPDPARPRAADR